MITLKNYIEYQKEAVVSKEILKTENGTITIFAFDVGQGLSEHTTPLNAFVQIIEGQADIVIDKVLHIVAEGQAIEFPANKPHSLKATKPFKMVLTMIK
ncbi:MAG: cupin domain-containing protein [Patescibacteria group bacterium]